jgi:hypothetical protein
LIAARAAPASQVGLASQRSKRFFRVSEGVSRLDTRRNLALSKPR